MSLSMRFKNSAQGGPGIRSLVSLIAGGAGLLGVALPAQAGTIEALRTALEQTLPNTEITSLRETPIPGLFEMDAGKNLFYVDQSGRYSIIGSLYDLTRHQDLTAARLEELGYAPEPDQTVEVAARSIAWDQLPNDAAIIENAGGAYKLAVFTDINCPYCRRLADILKNIPEIEVHTYLITLWQRSIEPTRAVLCADDKVAALHAAYKNIPLESAQPCATDALERTTAFAARHGISGTPFLIRSDGATSAGLRSKAFLLDWLKEAEQ